MPESVVEIWAMIHDLDPALYRESDPGLAPEIHVSFRFT